MAWTDQRVQRTLLLRQLSFRTFPEQGERYVRAVVKAFFAVVLSFRRMPVI